MAIPKEGEANSAARWGQRIAWLAAHGLNPSQVASQNQHKSENASKVAKETASMYKGFPKDTE